MGERADGRLRIALVHWALPPTTGGVESHLADLSASLAARRHRVTVVTGEAAPVPIPGVRIVRTPLLDLRRVASAPLRGEPYVRDLRDLLAEVWRVERFDVVHGHNLHHFAPEPALALDQLRRRFRFRLHHTFHETWPDVLHARPLYRTWDGNTATSRFVQEECEAWIGFRPDLLPLGIDTDRFDVARRPFEGGGLPTIVHPARLLPWKGVHTSVEMLERLRAGGIDARLIITDTQRIVDWDRQLDGYRRDILRMVARAGLTDRVVFRSASYAGMPSLYEEADIVVYPTVAREPFGLVPLEAMACARPVIASRCGGIPETIVHGSTGFTVEPGDAAMMATWIRALVADPGLARRIGRAGRDHVRRRFALDHHVDGVLARYQRRARHDVETAARVT